MNKPSWPNKYDKLSDVPYLYVETKNDHLVETGSRTAGGCQQLGDAAAAKPQTSRGKLSSEDLTGIYGPIYLM